MVVYGAKPPGANYQELALVCYSTISARRYTEGVDVALGQRHARFFQRGVGWLLSRIGRRIEPRQIDPFSRVLLSWLFCLANAFGGVKTSRSTFTKTKLTPAEVAQEWGLSTAKVLAFIRAGDLRAIDAAGPGRSQRRRYLIDVGDLEDFARRRRVGKEPKR